MFKIKYRTGEHVELPSLNEALRKLQAEYPDLYVKKSESSMLVWMSVEESEDDDGARAVAEILKMSLVRYAN